ncbi:MAG: hypothetical protein MJZ23_05495 [Paludibacteraceae bacterium]|nr:hypothetical protein [Paludibacteraceae bacterium]
MKIRFIPLLIAILLIALLAYGLYSYCTGVGIPVISISSAGVGIPLLVLLGVKLEDARVKTNISLVSILFLVIELGVNLFFCNRSPFSMPPFVIANGVTILIYILLVYGISSSKKS